MQYKAFVTDIDGTLIAEPHALPSPRVTAAIKKANALMPVILATGRPFFLVERLVNHLGLTGYAVVNDGAQIMDLKTKRAIIEQPLSHTAVEEIRTFGLTNNLKFFINDNGQDIPLDASYTKQNPLSIFIEDIEHSHVDLAVQRLSHIPDIVIHRTTSYLPNKGNMLINHVDATKFHGVVEVAKLLGINTHEMIGIGDGANDFPLLLACGLKVAMGNGRDDLKDIADVVAPAVTEDGVAEIIEKYILS